MPAAVVSLSELLLTSIGILFVSIILIVIPSSQAFSLPPSLQTTARPFEPWTTTSNRCFHGFRGKPAALFPQLLASSSSNNRIPDNSREKANGDNDDDSDDKLNGSNPEQLKNSNDDEIKTNKSNATTQKNNNNSQQLRNQRTKYSLGSISSSSPSLASNGRSFDRNAASKENSWKRASTASKQHFYKKGAPKKPTKTSNIISMQQQKIQPDSYIRMDQLQQYLKEEGYVRQADLNSISKSRRSSSASSASLSTSTSLSGRTAFPQASVLSYRTVAGGTRAAGGIAGLVLAVSILPHLWLVGSVAGACYGHAVSRDWERRTTAMTTMTTQQQQQQQQQHNATEPGALPTLLVNCGRRLGRLYLNIYDALQGIWFLYKTGQLSYEYYQRYSVLDSKLGIQTKLDAWNARFVKGKLKFDAWERQNEVGRKTLAALRTFWLVEGTTRQQWLSASAGTKRRTSKYRAVQVVYDGMHLVGRARRKYFGEAQGWTEFWAGVMTTRSSQFNASSSSISSLAGGVVTAVLLVNLLGAFFTLSPKFTNVAVIVATLAWPTWPTELWDRTTKEIAAVRARGWGEEEVSDVAPRSSMAAFPKRTTRPKNKGRRRPNVKLDKARYGYYYTTTSTTNTRNGRGKKKRKYYRKGQVPEWMTMLPWQWKRQPVQKPWWQPFG